MRAPNPVTYKIRAYPMRQVDLDTYHLLQELHLLLDDGDRRVLREFDLTNRQYHALQHLPPGTRRHLTEMSELLFCDKSNVTGLVERMVRDGLVVRDRSESDRRYLELHITEEGNRLREMARAAHEQSIIHRFDILSTEEKSQLEQLLNKLADGLRERMEEAKSQEVPAP